MHHLIVIAICVMVIVCIILSLAMRIYEAWLTRSFGSRHGVVFRGPKSGPRQKPRIALTFDDVPYNTRWCSSAMPAILNLLRQHQCQATCFVIGSLVKESPEAQMLRGGIATGHLELGNHGQTNSKHASLPNAASVECELTNCQAICKYRELSLSNYYRPGCGQVSLAILDAARNKGQTIVLGDVYSFDCWFPLPLLHWAFILNKVRDGSIVILHDRPWTPLLLKYLLPGLRAHGFACVTLSNLLSHRAE